MGNHALQPEVEPHAKVQRGFVRAPLFLGDPVDLQLVVEGGSIDTEFASS